MRAVLAIALLALLAAPALAFPGGSGGPGGPGNKPGPGGPGGPGNKPGPGGPGGLGPHPHPLPTPKPKPFKPVTGFVLVDSEATGFNGKPLIWNADSDSKVNILSNLVTNMTWQLVGKATVGSDILTESLYSVSWAYGSVVKAELDPETNKLAVTFFGDKTVPIREGRTLTLGPKAVVSYTVDKERNRLVNIAVKGQIDIDIRQAYLKPLKKWGRGAYADALEVRVTLLAPQPKEELSGVLAPVPVL